jgi:Flp pilus assembly protein TadB
MKPVTSPPTLTPRLGNLAFLATVCLCFAGIVMLELDGGDLRVRMGGLMKLLVWFIVSGALFYILYFLLSLPFRRAERARMFLELLEEGARAGNVERFLLRVAEARESSLGTRFHLLAAWLAKGVPLDDALAQVPRLLPPVGRAG